MNAIGLLFILLFSCSAWALKPAWVDYPPLLLSPLVVNGRELALVWVNPNEQQDNVVVDKAGLVQALQGQVRDSALQQLREVSTTSYLTQKDLAKLGMNAQFNQVELKLLLQLPPEIFSGNSLDLALAQAPNENVFKSASFSSYLNAFTTNYYQQDVDSRQSAQLDWVSQFHGHILDLGGFFKSDRDNNWTRIHSRYIYDLVETTQRFTAGDLRYQVTGFQQPNQGAGLSFEKTFSLRPRSLTTTVDPFTLRLERPSQVEIFVNGSLIHKGHHQAGELNLRNYPLITGKNLVSVVITDDRGRVERVQFDRFYHAELLVQGLTEYSFNVFNDSFENELGELEYQRETRGSAFFRYGLLRNLTTGVNFQSLQAWELAGIEAKYLTEFGLWNTNLAHARNADETNGSALNIIYNSLPRFVDTLVQFRGNIQYQQEDFSALSQRESLVNVYSSTPVRYNTGLGVGVERETYYDQGKIPENRLLLDITTRPSTQWQLGLNYQKAFENEREERVFLTLNWLEQNGKFQMFNNYNAAEEHLNSRAFYRPLQGKHNLLVGAGVDQLKEQNSQNAQVDYVGPRGELRFDHQQSEDSQGGSMQARFAVGMADGTVAWGRPVDNSFAIVAASSDVDYEIPVGRNQEFSMGEVDALGPLMLTNLTPYYPNRFAINPSDIPIGDGLEFETFDVMPGFKSGSLVKLKIEKGTSALFNVETKSGRALAYAAGEVLSPKGEVVGTFFTNKQGRAFVDNLAPGAYKIQFITRPGVYDLTIPKEYGIIKLKKLVIDD